MSKNDKVIDMSFVAAGTEGLKAMPDGEQDIIVTVRPNHYFEEWVDDYLEGAEAALAANGGTLSIERDELARYFRTLIASRVDFVRDRRAVVGPNETLRVPAFLTTVLSALGKYFSEDDGVWFLPQHEFTSDELLTAPEMLSVSRRLGPLEYLGYQMAEGYDRDRRGIKDLMWTHFLPEVQGIYSHKISTSTAVAPITLFLGLNQDRMLMGARIRVLQESTARNRLRALARVNTTRKIA